MSKLVSAGSIKPSWARSTRCSAYALTVAIATGFLTTACENKAPSGTQSGNQTSPAASSNTSNAKGLKIGSILPATGDVAAIGQPLPDAIRLAVDTVNKCGGVNGEQVTYIAEDDQSDPNAGAAAMTKLSEVDKVAGVVGSFASSVSTAGAEVATRNKVMMISPGSTSPVFTQRAKEGKYNGFWARTAPPDTYQAQALAKLAIDKGFKSVSTIAINNDYGVGFEKEFVKAFKKSGGTLVNEQKPTRYDPKAATFESEAAAAFSGKPQAVAALIYPETGSLLLKAAYQQGLSQGVQILLPDGAYAPNFPDQVGKSSDGKYIIAGALGTVPGANGPSLQTFNTLWKEKTNKPITAYIAHTWDATALLMLAAQAAKANTGEGIKSKIREISNAPGEEVSDLCKAMDLVRQGKDINYQGASSNVDIDENGDVVGSYDVWTVQPDGKLAVVGKVSPK